MNTKAETMASTATNVERQDLFDDLLKPENRADPYPFWTELAKEPVVRTSTGSYVVTGYEDVRLGFQDPRLSADPRNQLPEDQREEQTVFATLDPPVHDRLRRLTMKHFGPPARSNYLSDLRSDIERLVDGHLDSLKGETRFDLVERFAYPLPVAVISKVAGMPIEDEEKLSNWSAAISTELEFLNDEDGSLAEKRKKASGELLEYFGVLFEKYRAKPADNLLSRLVNDDADDAMNMAELMGTANLLLIGGHETTVSLISNAMLQLMRNPDMLALVLDRPELVVSMVEETLRLDPPVQFRVRNALADIEIGGCRIPAGSTVILAIAAANRDPSVFADPHRFDVLRPSRPHLSFAGGIHLCFGAPLGRMEAQLAMAALLRRLRNPRLIEQDIPYRLSPETRGPEHLIVEVDEIAA